MEWTVNQPVKLGFVGSTTGLTSFADMHLLKDGVASGLTVTTSEIGDKMYVATFTPTATGKYTFFVNGSIQNVFEVVTQTSQAGINKVLDEALGSWTWDKTGGVLTLYTQTGSFLASYNVVDNASTASRERVS